MTKHNTLGRAVAIVGGTLASAGALALLCADAFTTGNWTLQQALLPLVIVLAILFGWLFEHTLRRRQVGYAMALFLVFSLASGLTVYSSVGVQKEKLATKANFAEAHNAAIRDKKAAIKAAEQERALAADMLRNAESQLNAQCVVGRASKGQCDGIRATVSTYRGSEKGHGLTVRELQAELAALGGEHIASPKAEAFAELAAAFGFDRKAVVAFVTVFEPFAFALLFEVAAIVCFGYGFRPRQHVVRVEITPEPGPVVTAEPVTVKASERRATVHSFVAAHVARHGRAPQIPAVQSMHAARFGISLPKSTAHRWIIEAASAVEPIRHLRVVGG